jgi:tetratricopeptide (TPR) repeat protein
MLKKILYLLEKGGEDECKLSDLYSQVAEKLFEIEKSTTAAHSLGQLFFKLSESQKAEKYYLEAIEMSMEDKKLADLYYELALLYYSQMQNFPRAREYARKALGIDPNYGRAYSLIGKIYAASISDCSETELEQWAMYWLIVDQFVKAKSVDNSENLVKEANEYISIYSARFPTTEKLFWYDTNVGQSVNVGCWINETTTVRTSN